ncbi:MAG: hypothetical protein OEY94_05175 [Alphaproteobacteria bacterium]|nr:hypothetical protein [Alphaproteobacteria bacterium]
MTIANASLSKKWNPMSGFSRDEIGEISREVEKMVKKKELGEAGMYIWEKASIHENENKGKRIRTAKIEPPETPRAKSAWFLIRDIEEMGDVDVDKLSMITRTLGFKFIDTSHKGNDPNARIIQPIPDLPCCH